MYRSLSDLFYKSDMYKFPIFLISINFIAGGLILGATVEVWKETREFTYYVSFGELITLEGSIVSMLSLVCSCVAWCCQRSTLTLLVCQLSFSFATVMLLLPASVLSEIDYGHYVNILLFADYDQYINILLIAGSTLHLVCSIALIIFLHRYFRDNVAPSNVYSGLGQSTFRTYEALVDNRGSRASPAPHYESVRLMDHGYETAHASGYTDQPPHHATVNKTGHTSFGA